MVERTKELLLDYLGVAYGGMREASSQAALAAARDLGGQGGATVIGSRERLPAAWAAMVNGAAASALEMDDVTSKSSLHPGAAVFSAALAVAEELQAEAGEVLLAVVAGYEVTMRLGNALNPASAYARGFHPTGVAGAFGAAAAAGHLLRLDRAGFVRAFGIAETLAAGSLDWTDGAQTQRLNAGWAAHSGITAARLAAHGFTGPRSAIDGPLGLLHAYTGEPFPAEVTEGLGDGWQVLRVSIKPYPCCRYSHGLIDCMLELRRLDQVDIEAVESIELVVLTGGARLVAEPIEAKRHPATVVDAQFSAPFAAAVALLHGAAGPGQFCQANVDDPRVRSLMSRVTCRADPELDAVYPAHWPAAATLHLRNGITRSVTVPYPLGEPENPLPRAALCAKFLGLMDRPHGDELIEVVWRLPETPIAALLAPLRLP